MTTRANAGTDVGDIEALFANSSGTPSTFTSSVPFLQKETAVAGFFGVMVRLEATDARQERLQMLNVLLPTCRWALG